MNQIFVTIIDRGYGFQPVFLFADRIGPCYLDTQPTRNAANKVINKITKRNRRLVSLDKLYQEHRNRIHAAYEKSRSENNRNLNR